MTQAAKDWYIALYCKVENDAPLGMQGINYHNNVQSVMDAVRENSAMNSRDIGADVDQNKDSSTETQNIDYNYHATFLDVPVTPSFFSVGDFT